MIGIPLKDCHLPTETQRILFPKLLDIVQRQLKGQGALHDVQVRLLDGDYGPGDDDLVVAAFLEQPAVEREVLGLIGESDVVDPKEATVEE